MTFFYLCDIKRTLATAFAQYDNASHLIEVCSLRLSSDSLVFINELHPHAYTGAVLCLCERGVNETAISKKVVYFLVNPSKHNAIARITGCQP